jgi:hypothetical protein
MVGSLVAVEAGALTAHGGGAFGMVGVPMMMGPLTLGARRASWGSGQGQSTQAPRAAFTRSVAGLSGQWCGSIELVPWQGRQAS